MHDIHLADKILQICKDNSGSKPVKRVVIKLGKIIEHEEEIKPENLIFNLKLLAKGTNLDNAEFIVKSISGDSFEIDHIVV